MRLARSSQSTNPFLSAGAKAATASTTGTRPTSHTPRGVLIATVASGSSGGAGSDTGSSLSPASLSVIFVVGDAVMTEILGPERFTTGPRHARHGRSWRL